jgi:hypothetical protein
MITVRRFGTIVLMAFLAIAAFMLLAGPLHAQGMTVVEQGRGGRWGPWFYTVATSSTTETIACNSGVSPCSVNTATTVLNANTSRKSCLIQNINTADMYCKRATAGGNAASVTNMDFMLKGASGANKGDGGAYNCDTNGAVWTGAINCTGSAAGTVNVSGTL